jgi:hypothetical protein
MVRAWLERLAAEIRATWLLLLAAAVMTATGGVYLAYSLLILGLLWRAGAWDETEDGRWPAGLKRGASTPLLQMLAFVATPLVFIWWVLH